MSQNAETHLQLALLGVKLNCTVHIFVVLDLKAAEDKVSCIWGSHLRRGIFVVGKGDDAFPTTMCRSCRWQRCV